MKLLNVVVVVALAQSVYTATETPTGSPGEGGSAWLEHLISRESDKALPVGAALSETARCTLEVYQHRSLQGSKITITEDTPHFSSLGFNDKASSARIVADAGKACVFSLYQHGAYGGHVCVLTNDGQGTVSFDWLVDQGCNNDDISSVQYEAGCCTPTSSSYTACADQTCVDARNGIGNICGPCGCSGGPFHYGYKRSGDVCHNIAGCQSLKAGMVVALKGGRDNKYCADGPGTLECSRSSIGSWEKFTLLDGGAPNVFGIRGGRSGKVCADGPWETIECNRNSVGSWEKFTFLCLGDDTYAIEGGRGGKFCTDVAPKTFYCGATSIGTNQKFQVEVVSEATTPAFANFPSWIQALRAWLK